jgi:GNAT superfamily N-acetyltransferase
MKIKVRKAKVRDRGLFLKLWSEFLSERSGSLIKNSEKNLETFASIFDSYASGETKGICLFVAEHAVLMWGEFNPTFDITLNEVAQGWGTFVKEEARGKGVGKAIRKTGKKILKDMGFKHLLGNKENDDPANLGSLGDSRDLSTIIVVDL